MKKMFSVPDVKRLILKGEEQEEVKLSIFATGAGNGFRSTEAKGK